MNLLLDTHLLLWSAYDPARLSTAARTAIADLENSVFFSAASVWEVSIKSALARSDFDADPHLFRRGLIESGYQEIPITSQHSAAVIDLAPLHRDPFDRMLVAQSRVEGIALLTNDRAVAAYGSPVRLI